MKVSKQHGTIIITSKQIAGLMLIAMITLTVVFYVGVQFGKRKVINAEQEAQKQDEIKALARIKEAVNIAKETFSNQKGGRGALLDDLTIKEIPKKIDQKIDIKSKQILEKPLEPQKQEKIEKQEKAVFYTIKIGTFGTEENANNLADTIRKLGYEPVIKPDGELFHVTVGKFENEEEAKKLGDALMQKVTNIDGYMIKVYE